MAKVIPSNRKVKRTPLGSLQARISKALGKGAKPKKKGKK